MVKGDKRYFVMEFHCGFGGCKILGEFKTKVVAQRFLKAMKVKYLSRASYYVKIVESDA